MHKKFSFAWGKLYLATLALAASSDALPKRVQTAYRNHLGSLNSQNLPPLIYERLKLIRANFARVDDNNDEDDATINLTPLTERQASQIAEDIVSMYDELVKGIGLASAEARTTASASPRFH